MMSTTLKHTSRMATRTSAAAHTSIDAVFARRRGWLLLGVLASALMLAPGTASAQSIHPERALLNASSTATLHGSVGPFATGPWTAELSWPSGRQALLGSSGANGGFARTQELTERAAIGSYPDGEQALLGRRKPGKVGARSGGGPKP